MAAARVVVGFMKPPLSTLAVGRLTIGRRLNNLPHKRLTRWNWLSFWSLLKTKGRIGFVSFFCFGFVQGSPPGFGRCDQSGLFRFRVTFRDIQVRSEQVKRVCFRRSDEPVSHSG